MLVAEQVAGLVVVAELVVGLLVQVVVMEFVQVDLLEELLEAVSFEVGEQLGLRLVAWVRVEELPKLVG